MALIESLKTGDRCPHKFYDDEGKHTTCDAVLRPRYPGNDPENGPARLDCIHGHLEQIRYDIDMRDDELAREILHAVLQGVPVDAAKVLKRYTYNHTV